MSDIEKESAIKRVTIVGHGSRRNLVRGAGTSASSPSTITCNATSYINMASDRMREENRREAAHPLTAALMCTTRVRRRVSPLCGS
jgi:hypothetical protein